MIGGATLGSGGGGGGGGGGSGGGGGASAYSTRLRRASISSITSAGSGHYETFNDIPTAATTVTATISATMPADDRASRDATGVDIKAQDSLPYGGAGVGSFTTAPLSELDSIGDAGYTSITAHRVYEIEAEVDAAVNSATAHANANGTFATLGASQAESSLAIPRASSQNAYELASPSVVGPKSVTAAATAAAETAMGGEGTTPTATSAVLVGTSSSAALQRPSGTDETMEFLAARAAVESAEDKIAGSSISYSLGSMEYGVIVGGSAEGGYSGGYNGDMPISFLDMPGLRAHRCSSNAGGSDNGGSGGSGRSGVSDGTGTGTSTPALLALVRRPSQFVKGLRESLEQLVPKRLQRSDLRVGRLLGAGAYGRVFRATLAPPSASSTPLSAINSGSSYSAAGVQGEEDRVEVAVKELKPGLTGKARVHFLQEADLLAQFDHENIVSLIGTACLT